MPAITLRSRSWPRRSNGSRFRRGGLLRRRDRASHRRGDARTRRSDYAEDLKHYRAVERTPLTGSYKGYGIVTSPPPSSGGIGILQMLGMLQGSNYTAAGAGSAATSLSGGMHAALLRRPQPLAADPDFFPVSAARLLDPAYIASRRATINLAHASSSAAVGPGRSLPLGTKAPKPRTITSSTPKGTPWR